ncbi:uncharacterized protein LOC132918212 isoform X2 [Rhopalosiphum padi]|uniref:uncharacterized protein LOC132918212 isoform X2 n=1 Tax=Rhopalosiphum padi TaxID=40932 RepID=UPI00298DC412|nr:uncharacterized protein LOC132918212 isoform X2 [Rhopalosiphum padi]
MSMNYTCNQFDKAYQPTRLGNWEVPKWHLNRPKGRSTVTKVIANDRGHLLPGVQKTDQKHWAGLYLGTYQLPKRISKEIATELSGPKCQTWMKRSYHHPFIDRSQRNKTENGENNNKLEQINANKEQRQQPLANEDTDRDSIKSIKSAVSDMRAPNICRINTIRNCASADGRGPLNSTTDVNGGSDECDSGGTRRTIRQRETVGGGAKTPSSPALSRISASCGHLQTAGVDDEDARPPAAGCQEGPTGRRYGDAQRHHGLPDAIEDAVYRSLQTKRHKHPGLGLNGCWPKCSAVAYKSFNDPGPTQCSKLRVYRPKTSSSSTPADDSDEKKDPARRRNKNPSRPKTCGPVMTAQQLTDIKLALCWDLDAPFDRNRPPRPPDEPAVFHKVRQQLQQQQLQQPCGGPVAPAAGKPQNSSAVMGFVQTAGEARNCDDHGEVVPEARRTQTRECLMKNRNLSAVMELIPNKDRDGGSRPTGAAAAADVDDTAVAADQTVLSNDKPSSSSSSLSLSDGRRKNGLDGNDRNDDVYKSDDHHDQVQVEDKSNKAGLEQCPVAGSPSHRRRHRTAPQHHHTSAAAAAEKEPKHKRHGRHAYRPCLACDNPNAAASCKRDDECEHYKMAFKAGVPVSTPVRLRTAAAGKPAKHLKVPKPKTTNSDKKKYVIGTLLPPFSMWPGTTARDYPEHWRLTSVYRQAFKPLELRKQPLLQTVYL